MKRIAMLVAGAAMVALPVAGSAQMASTTGSMGGMGMYTAEVYLAQYWFDKPDGLSDRPKAGGFGGRITFGAPYMPSGHYFSRPSIGAFVTYTAGQQIFSDNDRGGATLPDISTLHVGGQLDWKLLPMPAGDVVDPFISVGAGLFRTTVKDDNGTFFDTGSNSSINKFALSPGVGANFTIQKGMSIGIRGDIKDVIIFSDDRFGSSKTTNNWLAEGGLSFTF